LGDPVTEGEHQGRPYHGRLPLRGGEAAVGAML
jgi:hypothetical protein